MERYTFLQISCVAAASNDTSGRHFLERKTYNLPKETSEMCNMQICGVLDLTSHKQLDPFPLIIGRGTKWRQFQCDFVYFNWPQKIEDLPKSKIVFAVILKKM